MKYRHRVTAIALFLLALPYQSVAETRTSPNDYSSFLAQTPGTDNELAALGQEATNLLLTSQEDTNSSILARYMDDRWFDGQRRVTARFIFVHGYYIDVFININTKHKLVGMQLTAHDESPGNPFDVAFDLGGKLCGYIRPNAFPNLLFTEPSYVTYPPYSAYGNTDATCEGSGGVVFTESERVFLRRLAMGVLEIILMRG